MTLSPEDFDLINGALGEEAAISIRDCPAGTAFDHEAWAALLNAARSNEAAKAAKMREALEAYDAAMTKCPVNNQLPGQPYSIGPCAACGATAGQNCGKQARAADIFIASARSALEPQPVAEGLAGEVG